MGHRCGLDPVMNVVHAAGVIYGTQDRSVPDAPRRMSASRFGTSPLERHASTAAGAAPSSPITSTLLTFGVDTKARPFQRGSTDHALALRISLNGRRALARLSDGRSAATSTALASIEHHRRPPDRCSSIHA